MAQDAFEYRIEIDSEGVDEAIEKVDVLNDHLKQTIELVDQLNLKGVEVCWSQSLMGSGTDYLSRLTVVGLFLCPFPCSCGR